MVDESESGPQDNRITPAGVALNNNGQKLKNDFVDTPVNRNLKANNIGEMNNDDFNFGDLINL